jgi:hypothetical protein
MIIARKRKSGNGEIVREKAEKQGREDFYFPDRNGSAIFLLKNEISGPIKKAVMIVPMPTTSKICPMEKPAVRQRMIPRSTHVRSPMILQTEKGIFFCRSDQIKVTAS